MCYVINIERKRILKKEAGCDKEKRVESIIRWIRVVGNNYILNKMKPIGPTLSIINVFLVVNAAGISRGVW